MVEGFVNWHLSGVVAAAAHWAQCGIVRGRRLVMNAIELDAVTAIAASATVSIHCEL